MRVSTKMVLLTLGLVIVPLILLIASLFLLNVYRPRSLGLSNAQEDTNIMNINVIRHFDELMTRLEERMAQEPAAALAEPDTVAAISRDFAADHAYLIACRDGTGPEEEAALCYYNGSEGNDDVLRYVNTPELFEDRDKLYFAGLSNPCLIGRRHYEAAGAAGSLYLVCDVSGSLPSVSRIIFLIGVSVLALVAGSILMLSWQRLRFARPMKQLQEAARQITEGNLDFELAVESDDEFGVLIGSFEEMRQRLKNNAEEQLHFEQQNRDMISNISHDLRTPITAIKGYVEGIRDGVASSPEKQEKYLQTIYNKAGDMEKLVDQLAIYSLVDSDRMVYRFDKIPVRAYFDDCRDELAAELEAQEVGLTYQNEAAPDIFVIGDPEQLHRVIGNLVSNSVKYRDAAKARAEITLTVREQGGMILISVGDNGRGISRANLPYIFDRFYRTDASRSSSTGGQGIGLSIVKKIVEDHGGRIWAASEAGVGTTVTVELRKYEEMSHEQNIDSGG